ncbi:type II secretion system protein J [Peribacillus sp. SCS-155]|uniref:PulJ/GspJ family protein n=1 Tax=Peribacillus sedimenti TaxID=3115297 RepID=UPI00390691BE
MKKLLSSNRGMTLIEVLLTLVIGAIVSGVIYSLFITGLNLYQKIQIEGQLRDDADYIATMILNELYTNDPTSVQPLSGDKQGIALIRAGTKEVNRYLIIDSEQPPAIIKIYFEDNQFIIEHADKEDGKVVLDSLSSNFTTADVDGVARFTEISIDPDSKCTKKNGTDNCTSGTIHLNLVLEDNKSTRGSLIRTKPLVLESSFGF